MVYNIVNYIIDMVDFSRFKLVTSCQRLSFHKLLLTGVESGF